jgi:hypothetical protein
MEKDNLAKPNEGQECQDPFSKATLGAPAFVF